MLFSGSSFLQAKPQESESKLGFKCATSLHLVHFCFKFHKQPSSQASQFCRPCREPPLILLSTFSHLYILYLVVNPCW